MPDLLIICDSIANRYTITAHNNNTLAIISYAQTGRLQGGVVTNWFETFLRTSRPGCFAGRRPFRRHFFAFSKWSYNLMAGNARPPHLYCCINKGNNYDLETNDCQRSKPGRIRNDRTFLVRCLRRRFS